MERSLRNEKAIVVNAFSRGGSNIVWSLLQSHPSVCGPLQESGELLYPRRPRWLRAALRRLYAHPVSSVFGGAIDRRLYHRKLEGAEHPDLRWKSEGVAYERGEVERSVLCLKSIDRDIALTDLWARTYGPEGCAFVGLVRNGYALCEGWQRRGRFRDARTRGAVYRQVVERMLADAERYPRYAIVRFEDVLADPFGKAQELFRFAGLEPWALEKLRFKVKKVLSRDGVHATRYGEEHRLYWFTRQSVHELLDPGVSEVQASRMDPREREAFEAEASPVLERFGYLSPAGR